MMLDETIAGASLTRMEEEVRRFWRLHDVPETGREVHRDRPDFRLYQGPLVAAGQSRFDQVCLLATTDLFARYHTMRGDAVQLQTGWVCHGLQIEVAAERLLALRAAGQTAAQDIPMAEFNAVCREIVLEGLRRGESLAERLGTWLDPAGTYASITPQAISAVWGGLHKLWEAGQLRRMNGIVPVCPRCATPLSSAEATRHCLEVVTHRTWVRLPWEGQPNAYLLAWTPEPWMLVGMVALAVDPDADYALVELAGEEGAPSEQLLLAERAVTDTLTGEFRYVRRIRGRALADVQYHPPFTYVPSSKGVGKVVLSRQVPPDRGTGLLAVMPGFDELSLALARANDLPIPDLLDDRGYLGNAVVRWRGLSPLVAEKYLIENLRERGLLFREEAGSEARSLCPYCDTPLLPLIRDVWQVPAQRGPWIIGRDRAWGVPLPVWCCQRCGEQTCVAGLDELAHRTGLDPMKIEPHRPAIDGLTLPCHACGGSMRRVEAVVDAAFEAAVLSLSSWPSPALHDRASQAAAVTDDQEGVQGMVVTLGDPDLGWIGDLEDTATLMQWPRGWRQAISVEEDGREADGERERDDAQGAPADTQRWAVYTGVTLALAEGGFLLPVWRLAMDLVTGPDHDQKQGKERPTGDALLDQWLMACLHESTWIVTRDLDAGDAQRAAETVTRLLGDLSLWHRLSERRGHRVAASVLSQLLAPFLPHLAEAIHRRLTKGTGQSVHLGNWPLPDPDWAEPRLVAGMSEVRELARLGETARLRAGIELERPLRQALVSMTGDPAGAEALAPFQTLLAQLLGAAQVRFGPDAGAQITWHLDLATEQAVQRSVPTVEIRAALASLAPEKAANLAAQLGEGLSVGLTVDDRAITLLPDEVVVTMQAKPGWIAAAGEKRLVVLEVA